jgi:S-DNA-T family DNA segregation ATPase FtsK/SpoIIIE
MVEDQSDDVWGLAFLLLGALAALGIYAHVIGPAGRALRTGAADVFGLARYGLPVCFAVLGVYLLWRHQRSQPGRVAVGLSIAMVAVSGMLEVVRGKSTLHQPVHAMAKAGGVLGAVVGVPLRAGLAGWGAGLVLTVILFLACLIITATPVRAVAQAGRAACGAGYRGGARLFSRVGELARRRRRLASATRHPSVRGPEVAARRRSGRPAAATPGTATPGTATPGTATPGTGDEAAGVLAGGGAPALGGRGPAPGPAPRAGFNWAGLAGGPEPSEDGDGEDAADAGPVPVGAGAGTRADVMPAARVEQLAIDLGLPKRPKPTWRLPPLALLRRSRQTDVDRRQVEVLGQTLEGALAAHGVETRLVGATVGPSVTRYELELGPGVKVQKVTVLQRDIAYAMAAADVRLIAPIPGRSAIGVEVPNRQRQTVSLGDILTSPEAAAARHPLEVAAGRDIAGRPVLVNLAEMPHLLIAGATGSGKSSCINSMLASVLMRATPDQVRLILVDPKRVELGHYSGLPHLLTAPVTNPKKAANALRWTVQEMERRYDLLAEVGMRDITGYNAAWDRGDLDTAPGPEAGPVAGPDDGPGGEQPVEEARYERLPFILVVVDELNDLMMVAARDVEESICRIAQMARAVGIHLVLATQRPSVDVITGLIKANIPSRLAFAVSSLADSRVVLDQPGAERLIGKGDMLLLTASSSHARRLQGPWVDEEDVRKVVAHWRRQSGPSYVEGVDGPEGTGGGPGEGNEDDDDLLEVAMELVVRSQLGSTSMLQRKLRVGFARAGRLMDLLEQRGVVGPSEGSKARAVLMTPEELEDR